MTTNDRPKILAVQTAFLGDVILTTPLLSALRRKRPEAEIVFMGTPSGAAVIEGHPAVDRVIAYDKRGAERGLSGFANKARELRASGFELALCAHRSTRSAALLAWAGIPRRIGFATADLPWLFHDRVPRPPERHEVERNLELIAPLGGPPEGFEPKLMLPRPEPAGPDLLGEVGGQKKVALCPGSVWATKRWPARGFAEAARAISGDLGARVFLLGAESDREAAAEVEGWLRAPVVNLAGKTGLRDWLRALSAMDLVITNDSSPTHLAGAFEVPVVTIFGPTTPSQGFAPWSKNSRVVEADLACRPCGEHGGRRCPEGHFKCMERIRPSQVVEAARSLLEGSAP